MVTLPCYKEVGANVRDPDVFLGMTIALHSKVIPGPLSNPYGLDTVVRYGLAITWCTYDSPGIAQRSSWRAALSRATRDQALWPSRTLCFKASLGLAKPPDST
jgi:hypothetical protein